jgi:hypothetical protein
MKRRKVIIKEDMKWKKMNATKSKKKIIKN